MNPLQHQFRLELFSGPPDIVPWPGIRPARLSLSNNAVGNIVNDIFISFTYGLSAG